jgi:predicted DsbA family dithiol-disulfide isomerase
MAMPVEVRYYTDPACSWSWGSEPKLRRLMWEFSDQLSFVWVMGGLAREYGPDYRDEEGRIGFGSDCFADLMAHWLDVGAETRMPIDPRLWTRSPIASSYPACQAAKAASEQGGEAAYRYLRRLREGLMVERRKLDHAEALVAAAGEVGLDVPRFRIDLGSHAIVEAFAADLEEVRDPPDEAIEAGMVKVTERNRRVSFPSAAFVGADEGKSGVWGWQPYDAYRKAAIDAGAEIVEERPAEPVEAIERFGRCATRELEELTGKPRPVLEAELWARARDWELRPVEVGGGTMWELP